jgi:DNA mismatch endonuclease (patch repair protein)
MSGIRSKNTKPELLIRKVLHREGFRFRLHQSDLPGKPDLVLAKYKAVIFVHGCFWHGHNCSLFKWPSSNRDFWKKKIIGNRKKDDESIASLTDCNFRILTVWECALRGKNKIDSKLCIARIAGWIRSTKKLYELRERVHSSKKK